MEGLRNWSLFWGPGPLAAMNGAAANTIEDQLRQVDRIIKVNIYEYLYVVLLRFLEAVDKLEGHQCYAFVWLSSLIKFNAFSSVYKFRNFLDQYLNGGIAGRVPA